MVFDMKPVRVSIYYDDGSESVSVLWVSRHEPLAAEVNALKERLGSVRIITAVGIIPSAEYIIELAERYGVKVVIPVLPLSVIARLVELARTKGITVLYARMREIARTRSREEAERLVHEKPGWRTAVEYSGGLWRVWEFERFEKIIKIEMVTEPW